MKGNKTALVTGCSSGIGYTTCLLLARNNFKTYGSVRDLSKAKKIQEVIDEERLPIKIIPLDVNDPKSISKAIRDILYDSGKLTF
jgi:NAD(P)-dependent dehydrogenase (short-subunit alcohol dehydrogenase family)